MACPHAIGPCELHFWGSNLLLRPPKVSAWSYNGEVLLESWFRRGVFHSSALSLSTKGLTSGKIWKRGILALSLQPTTRTTGGRFGRPSYIMILVHLNTRYLYQHGMQVQELYPFTAIEPPTRGTAIVRFGEQTTSSAPILSTTKVWMGKYLKKSCSF
jgi:hypothetical protein